RTLVRVVEDVVRRVLDELPDRIENDKQYPERRARARLADRWLRSVESSRPELTDRGRRCASGELPNCSAAATVDEADPAALARFDWVVIEETAKAWPQELLVPLVAGVRWTLVGDHKQLGPHRAHELKDFLTSLEGRREVELQGVIAGRD